MEIPTETNQAPFLIRIDVMENEDLRSVLVLKRFSAVNIPDLEFEGLYWCSIKTFAPLNTKHTNRFL